MSKKILLFTLTFLNLFTFQAIFSKPVDVQTAQAIAINFYKLNATSNSNATFVARLKFIKTEENNSIDYYIFDVFPKGFVIVAADDASEPILAYSNEAFFDLNVTNTGIQDWMDDVANNINYLAKNNIQPTKEISSKWVAYANGENTIQSRSTAVSPMLKTTWNQSIYYNTYCPGGSVTGCVATAMAQIMKYWNYPSRGTGSYSYTDMPYGKLSADFTATSYNWSAMTNALTSSSTTVQKNAVALLMSQLGISVATQYGTTGSASWVLQLDNPGGPCAQSAYVNYFGYNSSTILGVKKANYTSATWIAMMKNDLNAGRPIQYEGFGTEGGHTWVCDGYNMFSLFHMNWGWGGVDNGYFSINVLNPNGIPLGTNNGAIFGIQPIKSLQEINSNAIEPLVEDNQQNLELAEASIAPESFNIYPVPASTVLNVNYNGSIYLTSTIVIANTLGQTIASYPSVNLNTNYILDISNYAPGIYFISFVSSDSRNRKVLRFYKD